MYPPEASFTQEETEIIFRIRQLIGDEIEVFIDNVNSLSSCNTTAASGTIYQLEDPKGYPHEIRINGVEYASTSGTYGVNVIGHKYLKFEMPVVQQGSSLFVMYDHFRNSNIEILTTYDTAATTYLTSQCNLSVEELSIDLLVLATAYVLMTRDLHVYIKEAVKIEDSDSSYDASRRPATLMAFMKNIQDLLKDSLESKLKCKMNSLPVYKIE